MRRPVRILLVTCALLLAVTPVPTRTEAVVRVDTVSLGPVSQIDAPALRDLDGYYTWAAAQTTTTTTTTVPPSATEPTSEESERVAHFDPGSVQALIVDIFGDAAPAALHVAHCESGFDPYAENGQFRGVFQIGEMHADDWRAVTGYSYWSSWMNPAANVTYARSLYDREGWGPWECRP